MPTLRFEAVRTLPQVSITFDEATEEELMMSANVTDYPLQAAISEFEFVQDHSQRKPNIWTVEAVVTETPLPGGIGSIPMRGDSRIASTYLLLDQRLENICYYTTAKLGVIGPCLLVSASMGFNNRGMSIISLELKEIKFAHSELVQLPPAVPKRRKPPAKPGPQTKKKDTKSKLQIKSEIILTGLASAFSPEGLAKTLKK